MYGRKLSAEKEKVEKVIFNLKTFFTKLSRSITELAIAVELLFLCRNLCEK